MRIEGQAGEANQLAAVALNDGECVLLTRCCRRRGYGAGDDAADFFARARREAQVLSGLRAAIDTEDGLYVIDDQFAERKASVVEDDRLHVADSTPRRLAQYCERGTAAERHDLLAQFPRCQRIPDRPVHQQGTYALD